MYGCDEATQAPPSDTGGAMKRLVGGGGAGEKLTGWMLLHEFPVLPFVMLYALFMLFGWDKMRLFGLFYGSIC